MGNAFWGVSIHAPVWGATKEGDRVCRQGWFQSTHPCGVRRGVKDQAKDINVSIHAPVWGATKGDGLVNVYRDVSIHAPVWGATKPSVAA